MTGKHRITVNLEDDEYQALQRLATGSDRSLAWLGRRAICDLIRQAENANDRPFIGASETSEPSRQSAP